MLDDFGFLRQSETEIPDHLSKLFLKYCDENTSLVLLTAFSEVESNENFRKALYSLHFHDTQSIADIGYIDCDLESDKKKEAIRVLGADLLKLFPTVIFMSDDDSLQSEWYSAYGKTEQLCALCDVRSYLELTPESNFTKISTSSPNYLYHYALLGTETYYNSGETLNLIDQLGFSNVRLGNLRGNASVSEPLLRNSDFVSINTNVLKASELLNSQISPNGLYAEELCQIAHYIGLSDQNNLLVVCHEFDLDSLALRMLSQLFWCYTESYSKRCGDYPVSSFKTYRQFTVLIDNQEEELIFLQSNISGRWWLKAPKGIKNKTNNKRHALIPCNFEDYETAKEGVLPDCWWTEVVR